MIYCMSKAKVIRLEEDVYNALFDMKCVYRERSMNDAIAHMLADLGVEPFDDGDYDGE